LPLVANLLEQNFVAHRPDQVWLADISYIPTSEGWLYLAEILDLFTREVVGWAMREHMRAELTIAALIMSWQSSGGARGQASSTIPIASANTPPASILRLALASIALALGLGRAAVASEVTTPVEQLQAGLMAIMQADKTAPFRQRYDMIAPVIGRTFDLEVILRQVIGPHLAAASAPAGSGWGRPFNATLRSRLRRSHDRVLRHQFRH